MKRLFGIRWDVVKGQYVPDASSKILGYYENEGGKKTIKRYKPPEIETPGIALEFSKPTLGVIANNEKEENDESGDDRDDMDSD